MGRFLVVAGACACALTGDVAQAATVTATDRPHSEAKMPTITVRSVVFTAAPGEANRVEVSRGVGGLRLHDPAGIQPTAPCVAEDAQSVVCPDPGGVELQVSLGDGDDTLVSTGVQYFPVDAGPGDDVVDVPNGALAGGPGNDTLTGGTVRGGAGDDTIAASSLDYRDHVAGVTVDVAAGLATAAGEVDRFTSNAPWVPITVETGPGPDVVRAAPTGAYVHMGDGADVFEGGPVRDYVDSGAGDDVIRTYGGDDDVFAGPGNDRVEAGEGADEVNGDKGDDTIDGGPGVDHLIGDDGADTLLARDGQRDDVDCGWESNAAAAPQADRATLDARDDDTWCTHIDRSGAGRLELHGARRTGARTARVLLSCTASRACTGRLRLIGARARVQRVRVPAGRTRSVPIRVQAKYRALIRVSTPAGRQLRATLFMGQAFT